MKMSCKFATWLKTHLFNCINELASTRSMFVRNPQTDFTRKRKLTFSTVMSLVLQMTGASLNNEILRFFQHQPEVPSTSAFVQQREKILPVAFKELFTRFTRAFDKFKLFKGYRLLACDSSKINIPFNKEDLQTLVEQKNGASYNLICLHALYDLVNNIYVDCIVAPQSATDEREALREMIGHCEQHTPTLSTLDRGYEGYNTIAHFSERRMKFVMRVKDIHSNGILSGYNLPDGEFDLTIQTILTRKQTNHVKENKGIYTFLSPKTTFDFIDDQSLDYPMRFRAVCIKITENNYECLVTNLDEEHFSAQDLKKIYGLRWGIESSFRDLKYTIDILHFHSKKQNCILQEIYAHLVLFNFCAMIVNYTPVTQSLDKKYEYKINFVAAVGICRAFLLSNGDKINVDELILKYLVPIRPNRSAPRNPKTRSAKSFLYRAA